MEIEEDRIKSSIRAELANLISKFRETCPEKHSYGYIEKKSDIVKSYIHRAANNELGQVLDKNKIMAIINVIGSYEDKKKFANF